MCCGSECSANQQYLQKEHQPVGLTFILPGLTIFFKDITADVLFYTCCFVARTLLTASTFGHGNVNVRQPPAQTFLDSHYWGHFQVGRHLLGGGLPKSSRTVTHDHLVVESILGCVF